MRRGEIAALVLAALCTVFIVFYAINVAKTGDIPEREVEIATTVEIDTSRVIAPTSILAVTAGEKVVKLPRHKKPTQKNNVEADSSLAIVDSAEVIIPVERKVYQDSNFRAVVSGYDVSLDTIEVYSRHEITTIRHTVTTPKRWGIGLVAGYGYTPHGFQPFAGIAITYNLILF